jgi:phosphoglucomutase
MAQYIDTTTGFPVCDPECIPLSSSLPSRAELDEAFKPLILSASGWRKVFAATGDEEDARPDVGDANIVIAAHMADVFAAYILARIPSNPTIVLGLDSRPTGPEIGDAMLRVFLSRGIKVRYLFIASAPEIMAYARGSDGFAYISASHNPVGHNGVKFGLADGGVLPGSETNLLIAEFRKAIAADDAAIRARNLLGGCAPAAVASVLAAIPVEKKAALAAYAAFTREVVSGESGTARQDAFFAELADAAARGRKEGKPVSLVCDFNGSARAVSIDRAFFESAGLALFGMNEGARKIAHRIVPEGESLSFCAREIERLRREGKTADERGVSLGYVPDCDGDRGNIVYWNEKTGKADILEAQEVFALSVIAELSHLVYQGQVKVSGGKATPPVGVAVNDPTSLRIEAIARSFGATVGRAEVGEANVVNLAREMREAGTIVRILGEGSNGGNITHPAAVRDPVNTVCALLKMLVLRGTPEKPGLFRLWCELSGQPDAWKEDFTLADIIATLPAFVTTSAFEKEAALRITSMDHTALKRSFQTVFVREWETRKDELRAKYGFASWVAIANNGTRQTIGIDDFGVSGKGGLTVRFLDAMGKPLGIIWMRGSGTEPVFRILAEVCGSDASAERDLLAWLTRMVLEADSKI